MSQSFLTTVRQWLVLLGGGLTCLASLIIAVSFTGMPLPESIRWPGDDSTLVVGFLTVITLLGMFILNLNFMLERGREPLPEPETTPAIPQAGSEFDRHMKTHRLVYRSPAERRDIRERLRETAIQTVRQTVGCSRSRAVTIVNNGEWTEHPTAAAFLGQETFPRFIRLCNRVSRRLLFQYAARQTARAIITYANESNTMTTTQ